MIKLKQETQLTNELWRSGAVFPSDFITNLNKQINQDLNLLQQNSVYEKLCVQAYAQLYGWSGSAVKIDNEFF